MKDRTHDILIKEILCNFYNWNQLNFSIMWRCVVGVERSIKTTFLSLFLSSNVTFNFSKCVVISGGQIGAIVSRPSSVNHRKFSQRCEKSISLLPMALFHGNLSQWFRLITENSLNFFVHEQIFRMSLPRIYANLKRDGNGSTALHTKRRENILARSFRESITKISSPTFSSAEESREKKSKVFISFS